MQETFMTGYEPLEDGYQDDGSLGNHEMIAHVVPEATTTRWNHIKDLDSFFARLYQYHQSNGMMCMILQHIFDLVQLIFIVFFTTFIVVDVNYDILFGNTKPEHESSKVSIHDVIYPYSIAKSRITGGYMFILFIASVFWVFKLIYGVINCLHFSNIKKFYNCKLGIQDHDLDNFTWDDVQYRIIEVQVEERMCIHKEHLSELDINHRILRFKNYLVAMINKDILPLKIHLPFLGETVIMTKGLQYNIEFLLFWGPWSPFKNSWQLSDSYKKVDYRNIQAAHLRKQMLYLGLANFVLCPLVFIWQLLNVFYSYTELLRREPGTLGLRRWSHYGELYLRHFNELDHELRARLNRGYRPAVEYTNIYTDPLLVAIAKFVGFISGSVFSVLLVLTLYDGDVIQVEHVLTIMTILAATAACCRACIPKENQVYAPEILMTRILSEVHYLPDSWKGKAHMPFVRHEFSQLFQSKVTHIIEELCSSLTTSYLLCTVFRHKALDIVDFFRNFTVEVVGVGDICSFAQMDIRKHGSQTWQPEVSDLTRPITPPAPRDRSMTTDCGKTELSLLHFTISNPKWKPPQESSTFLNAFRAQAQKDCPGLDTLREENALYSSENSVGGAIGALGGGVGAYGGGVGAFGGGVGAFGGGVGAFGGGVGAFGGGVGAFGGGVGAFGGGLGASGMRNPWVGATLPETEPQPRPLRMDPHCQTIMNSLSSSGLIVDPFLNPGNDGSLVQSVQVPADLSVVDMCRSALLLHDVHRRRMAHNAYSDNPPPQGMVRGAQLPPTQEQRQQQACDQISFTIDTSAFENS